MAISTALFSSGCSMCCGPYDYHYPTFGGIVQRSDPVYGRVGSLFSDPGPLGGPSADSNLTPRDGKKPTRDPERFQDDLEELDSLDIDGDRRELPAPNNRRRPGPDDTITQRYRRNQSRLPSSRWR